MSAPPASPSPHPGLGFRAFVALIALLMAMNAIAIDIMLPALPAMARDFGLPDPNEAQWIIAAYVLGFGVAQLVYGPVSDRYGRRPVLLVGLVLYMLTATIAAFADTFATMIVARILQGIAAASTRVIASAVVRDCYSGRQMARVMSLSFMVFLAVPVMAPAVGQVVLMLAPWHSIFALLAVYAAGVTAFVWLRMPETLHPEYRQPLQVGRIVEAARTVVTDRAALGYSLALALMFGSLMAFINSSQQIFAESFHAPGLFPIAFAACAGTMACGSYVNSRLVERLGTRRLSHGALAGFVVTSALHAAVALTGFETIWTFVALQALGMLAFSFASSNFGAMAMENLGAIAGTASSLQGFTMSVGGAVIGIAISQGFDGTTVPIVLGYLVAGLAALAVVAVTERGRLFRSHQAPA
jgi:DHA1 family bicyclomycin/chloramphenicol resistance-like MFS transporter